MAEELALTSRQLAAVPILAAGGTIEAAAAAAGVTPRTVNRWRLEAPFTAAVRDGTGDLYESAMRRLAGGLDAAAGYLVDVAAGAAEADRGRVNAARLVLTLATAQREAVELAERVALLEQREGFTT